jgi:hypothetical protein
MELNLSDGQRQTILNYATSLPAQLAERLAARGTAAKTTQFTLDELDDLLDHVEESAYRAKGNEKQKVLRIAEKVSKLLGSTIDPDQRPGRRRAPKADTIFQIKITLRGIDPPIWRRIQTRDCTLDVLHTLIQVTMGWDSEHLYRFDIGGVEYADLEMMDDEEMEDACDTRLSDVLPVQNRRPRFLYLYDFGDDWLHQLTAEERFPPEEGVPYPRCVSGQRACPPEDCGGPWGYADIVESLSNPNHARHEEMLDRVGGEFDSERFDLEGVNDELRRLQAPMGDRGTARPDKKKASAEKPAPLRWEFDPDIPTHDFLEEGPLDDLWNLHQAVEDFVYWVEKDQFLTWEGIVCQEQRLPLTAAQKEVVSGLLSFNDEAEDDIHYIDEIPRPSEPWYVILNKIVPHLLIEPFRTFDVQEDVQCDGWDEIMTALEEHGQGLSLPPGVASYKEVVPADLRHKLWMQSCFDILSGLGQDADMTLEDPEEHYRIDEFLVNLRECKDSVAHFGLTLESLLRMVILPEKDQPLFIKMMQDKLPLNSMQEPIANHL